MIRKKLFSKLVYAIALLCLASVALPLLMGGKIKTITQQSAELSALLGDMAWVSPGLSNTRALYEISFRTCPACIAYHKTEFPKLQNQGVDTRLFVYARETRRTPPQERAVIAELYKNRNWQLAQDWYAHTNPRAYYAKMKDVRGADGNLERTASIATGQQQIRELYSILAANDVEMATPTLLWQDTRGTWKVVVGNNPVTNSHIRKQFGAVQ